jgi:histidinol-phosphate aminotransferase
LHATRSVLRGSEHNNSINRLPEFLNSRREFSLTILDRSDARFTADAWFDRRTEAGVEFILSAVEGLREERFAKTRQTSLSRILIQRRSNKHDLVNRPSTHDTQHTFGITMINFRDNVKKMQGYVPGEQPPPGSKVVKLNTNENPYPPSPEVMKVLKGFEGEWLRRYPDPVATMAREAAAKVYGVPEDWVMAANGSDEMLALLARAFLEKGRRIAYPVPTYSLYITLAEMQDAATVEVPYDEEYNLPVAELIEAQADLTFVCSPNNPSATMAPAGELDRLASGLKGVLVVDEAYTDFADGNALGLVSKHQNVIVLRTLSKGYSLAGLRLGFGIAQPQLLEGLIKIKDSYNVDAVALRLGAAAMNDQVWMKANAGTIKASRAKLEKALTLMKFRLWPSQANFILARPPRGDARYLYHELRDRGILVRYWDRPRLDDKIRITVGTDEENQALLEALKVLS